MKKLAQSAIILTSENTAAQLIDDTVAQQYRFVQTSALGVCVLGPIPYGKTVKTVKIIAQKEFQNAALIGGATVEVIAASARYTVSVWNRESDYESQSQGPMTYSTTAPTVLSGDAFTDRLNVFTALANKINAYAPNNCVAYLLAKVPYTLGTSVGDAATNFVVGEVVTQETSTITAQVAACSISSGTFAGDNAAGTLWLYNFSNVGNYDAGTKKWTAAGTAAAVAGISNATTNCEVTGTAASHKLGQGLVIVDDAGYFTSTKYRGGANSVGIAGFGTATVSTIIPYKYSIGVGTDMLALRPVFAPGNQDVVSGNIEYAFNNGDLPVAGQYYTKYIIEVAGGDEDALDARVVSSLKHYILYFNQSSPSDHVTDLDTALATVIAK